MGSAKLRLSRDGPSTSRTLLGPAPTLSVIGPLGSQLFIHILLSGQSMEREQWPASGTLWLNSRAVSMEEAVGCVLPPEFCHLGASG